ncbi:MAG TPA: alpha-2-macroglobulin family protein [Anaerolineaceae bacterium]|nr:alpha-2-macroglobulin family protein [Anaerolineaceae bacterium]
MADQIKQFLNQYRLPLMILAVLVIAAGGVYAWRTLSRPVGKPQPIPPAQTDTPSTTGAVTALKGASSQISIHLSQGKARPAAVAPVKEAAGDPLPEDQTAQLLARLPAFQPEPGNQTDFKLAQGPIPPPRTGETIQQAFPPPPQEAQPPAVEAGPLQVLRFAPEGEIPIAPFVNVTFNQPMVAVGTLGDLAAQSVPVQMEPSLPGTWRWLGTQTLNFTYDSNQVDRLPKATTYKITVPAGTRSATGGVLEKSVEWSFSTPPAKMTFTYPGGDPQPLDPLFFIGFDQRIDPGAVFATIHVSAGNQAVSIALVGETEVRADEKNAWLLNNVQEGRWIAFRARESLPDSATVTVTVGPGTPSAEGPLLTRDAQSYSFQTYSPLSIVDHGCAWGNNPCQPLAPFFIRFNNPIDPKAYTESMLKVVPEIPGVFTNIYGDTIQIQGETKGQTTYTVTVSGEIQDTFGQKLGKDQQLTFRVGPADPQLFGPGDNFVTLDPAAAKPVFSVYAMNYQHLDLKIYAVQPEDWPAFKAYLRAYQQNDGSARIPGRLVQDRSIPVEAPSDTLTEVPVDLSPLMDGKFSHFVITIAPPAALFQNSQDRYWRTIQAWVQVTQIGLDAYTDHSEMVVWTSSLKDGAPLAGIDVTAQGGWQVTTGADGTARAAIPQGATYLIASQGADKALLPRSNYFWGDDAWTKQPVSDELRWYVFDDRQIYRPGEEVHVKGWLRRIGGRQGGDVSLVGGAVTAINYQVTSSLGNEIGSGRAEVNALGGFDFVYKIPDVTNLGNAWFNFNAEGSLEGMANTQSFQHTFQIEEFRRPEFEVTARNETSGPYFAGGQATLAVEAKYYAGGPLPDADVTWSVTSSPGSYSPPNWPDFTFGVWQPWWLFERGDVFSGPGKPGNGTPPLTFSGKTDATGTHYLDLDFATVEKDTTLQPVSIVADATVMDVNRQAWTGTTTLLVHPAALYVGLRGDRYFVERGTPLKVQLIVTDLDGNAQAGRAIEVQAARLEWKLVDGNWKQVEADVQSCSATSAEKPVECTFQTPVGGTYQITAVVSDDQGRKNQSQLTRWVSGEKLPPARRVEQEKANLIPDKENYRPGDTAQILVQSPFAPAEGLLTVTRNGLVSTQRFHIEDGTTTLQVPVHDQDVPNLNVQVDLNGSAPRSDDQGQPLKDVPARPAFATGQLNLKIPPVQRTLSLSVDLKEKEIDPGGETSLAVELKDAAGQPVADAQLAVVVVDEAILALSNYQLADPLAAFYSDRPGYLASVYARSSIVLANPQALAQNAGSRNSRAMDKAAGAAAPQMEMAMPAAAPTQAPAAPAQPQGPNGAPEPIRVRSDFNPLAVFSPSVTTDADGRATVEIKVPDNLTRYRVMVVAVDSGGRRFGKGETSLTARLPLMVRPSAPRFLNFGDAFELPVVLQNQTGEAMSVDVAVRVGNLEITGPAGLKVAVPARDRVEVRFPMAARQAGTAQIQVAASAGSYADAATLSLPVYTPATTEAFATYGVLDNGAVAQPVASPGGVFPQYGGLEITTSSTALQALTDAVLYLTSYPYECSEQLASRILAVASLRDVLTAFKADGLPSPEEMESAVQRDLTRLQGMQNDDGGFPYWRRGAETSPFNTVHVAHALYSAGAKGFSVPGDMQARVLEYLRNIESHYPTWYSQHTRWTLSAYALNVRGLFGDRDPQKASKLLNEAGIENIGLDALGWLWPLLDDASQLDALRRFVTNHAVETAGAANFTTSYDDQNYLLLGSDRRTDAILLDALIVKDPQADLIPKLVNGLLAHKVRGHWGNTQEDVFVLLALDRYFNTYESQTPDFIAQIWLGQGYAGSHQFQGRSTERQETDVPMSYLVDQGGTQNLTIQKEGPGRLYYRLGIRYAPSDLVLDPLDMGFVVQRSYEALDHPEDVSQDSEGVWHIKAGARVRVHLTMVARDRRYHVALVDPLPAGLEIVNPDLAVSGRVPQDPNSPEYKRYGWWWWGTWYEHQNLRDERAEAFTTLLWDGVYQYTYVARATTPGRFVVPPAKAEEMYSPEVFGRSASSIVIVE